MGRLVDVLHPLVLAAARQRFPGRPADDVAVEAFVRVWADAGAYDARRSGPLAWILDRVNDLAVPAPALAGDPA